MTHIEFVSAEWCGPSVEMRHTLDAIAQEFPEVQVRKLDAEEIATPPEAIPVLRLVVDGKRVKEHVGNQPRSVVRKFFMEAMGE